MKKELLAALLLLTLLLPFAAAEKTEAEQTLPMLELHQVNLGCADGYLIRFGNTTVLIDGAEGGRTSRSACSRSIWKRWA
ncbi:MAG: hypothetical protein ACLT74_02055 [Christensenellales bacterium]